jgi:hypothetical protein
MLQFHIVVMYVYAATTKLDGDWLAGRPVRVWMEWKADLPLVGPILDTDAVVFLLSWGGLLFDALIVPGLLWRRTRTLALVVMVGFHTFNGLVLDVFPLPVVATIGSLLLLPPDWPRRLFRRPPVVVEQSRGRALSASAMVGLGLWVLAHLLIPFRHHAYPGSVAWNEDGDEFAWRLRARTKKRRVRITVVDPETGAKRNVRLKSKVTGTRRKAVRTYPDRLLQLAHHIAAEEAAAGRRVEVHVRYRVGLNGRSLRDLIDGKRDLAAQPRTFLNSVWTEPRPVDEESGPYLLFFTGR